MFRISRIGKWSWGGIKVRTAMRASLKEGMEERPASQRIVGVFEAQIECKSPEVEARAMISVKELEDWKMRERTSGGKEVKRDIFQD